MRKIKVVEVITHPDMGGAQAVAVKIRRGLDKTVFDAFIAGSPKTSGGKKHHLSEETFFIPINANARTINPLKAIIAFFQFYRAFRKLKPDILHTHTPTAGITARFAAFFARVPVIIHTFHGFGFNPAQNFLARAVFITAEKICALIADKLVFVSKNNIETARRLGIGNPKKYHLIRAGVELKNFAQKPPNSAVRAEFGASETAPVILSVANLKKQKNPLDFVMAAGIVSRAVPSAFFVFTGDGPLRKQTEELSEKLNLSKNCIFPGWRKDIADLISVSKIFVLTSLWEGLPCALIEAMKGALVPVCYAVDGIGEIIKNGENGFLIEPGNYKDLAEKIRLLLTDDNIYNAMRAKALQTNFEEFDIEKTVTDHAALYKEVAKI